MFDDAFDRLKRVIEWPDDALDPPGLASTLWRSIVLRADAGAAMMPREPPMPDPAFWLIMIAVVGVFIAGAVLSWLTGRFGEQRVNIVASALIAGVSYAASILVAFGLAAAGAEESTIMAVALFVWMGGIAGLLMLRSRIDLKTAVCIAALFGAVYVGYALAADLLLEPLFETLRQSAE